jgi:hypothetical protein
LARAVDSTTIGPPSRSQVGGAGVTYRRLIRMSTPLLACKACQVCRFGIAAVIHPSAAPVDAYGAPRR